MKETFIGPSGFLHLSGRIPSISHSLLRLYIINAELNLRLFLLSLAHPLSYHFIDLSSGVLL